MVLYYFLAIACTVGFVVAEDLPQLFSSKCCYSKKVGPFHYTQVPGNTEGYNCDPGCVYTRDDLNGSRFCFASGGDKPEPVECTESTVNSGYINVTRINTMMSFQTDVGSFDCDLQLMNASLDDYQMINCSLQQRPRHNGIIHEDRDLSEDSKVEKASYFSSWSSEGNPEWMFLHTSNECIHCELNAGIISWLICWIKNHIDINGNPIIRNTNQIYTQGSEPVPSHADKTLNQSIIYCRDLCNNNSCNFWTLSYHNGNETSRNHRDLTECGMRNYSVFYYTETDPDQYAGFGIEGQFYYYYGNFTFDGTVFVYLRDYGNSIKHCEKLCDNVLCTTFTWNKKKSLCSLNKFTPTRKINLSGRMPNPELISVCYPDRTNCTVPEV